MQLILDIVKNGKNKPKQKSFRFEKNSGWIGRSDDADFQLTDPQNYISGKHVYVEYNHDRYYLRDESTNGTFLKHPYKKLPKGVPHPVEASEVFVIGDHELQARFSNNDYTDDFIVGGGVGSEPEPLDAVEELIPDDDFLMDDKPAFVEAAEPDVKAEENDVLGLLDERSETEEIIYDDDEALVETAPARDEIIPLDEHIEMPGYREAPAHVESPVQQAPAKGYEGSFAASLRVLEEKLGLEIVSLPNKERDALMAELAGVLVNSLEGLRNSLYVADRTKQEMHLPSFQTESKENNPVRLGKSASQLLQNEKIGGKLGMLKLSDAVTKSYAEIDAHTIALHGASKNLMGVAVSHFAPKNLEYKFESTGALRAPLPRQCLLWKAYKQMFEHLNESPESGVEMLAPHFAKEYEKLAFSVGLASVDAIQKR